MKRCSANPYKGSDSFIFVSYCPQDRRFVYPIIESLSKYGYRLWHNEGITAECEWNEVAADHMSLSSLCLAFVSETAVASHNWRREIISALQEEKPLFSVFLEETILSPGLKMQLTENKYIFAYKYLQISKLLDEVSSAHELKLCLGVQNPLVTVQLPIFYNEPTLKNPNMTISLSDEWFETDGRTEQTEYVLVRQPTAEAIPINSGYLHVGKEIERMKNSYVISGNLTISRTHFFIKKENGVYMLTDNNSKNRTYLNAPPDDDTNPLPPKVSIELKDGDTIRISKGIDAIEFIFQAFKLEVTS